MARRVTESLRIVEAIVLGLVGYEIDDYVAGLPGIEVVVSLPIDRVHLVAQHN